MRQRTTKLEEHGGDATRMDKLAGALQELELIVSPALVTEIRRDG